MKGRQTKASCPGAGGREIEDKVEIQEKYVNIDSYLYIKFAVKFALQRSVVCIGADQRCPGRFGARTSECTMEQACEAARSLQA